MKYLPSWKRLCTDTEVVRVEVIPYTEVKEKISVPSDLFAFLYSSLKLPECLCTKSRVGKNEWALVHKNFRAVTNFVNEISCFIMFKEINKIIYYLLQLSIMFLRNKNVKYFSSIYVLRNKVCVWRYRQWLLKLLCRDILKIFVILTSNVAALICTSRGKNQQNIVTRALPL